MNQGYSKDYWCGIRYINGKQIICLPDGTPIPAQISSTVTDTLNDVAVATVQIHINLKNVKSDSEK
jgi:hypothetical protein